MPSPTNPPTLPFTSLNPSAQSTILLIHGAFVDHTDWDLVTPHLPTYHLLLPDLPGHGSAHTIRPYSKALSAKLLADLIQNHAIGGKAHIVGLSLGASVALELACTYPDVVNDVFISGIKVFPQSPSIAPHFLWLESRIENLLPRSFISWLMDGTDIRPANTSLITVSLCREVLGTITFSDPSDSTKTTWPSPWPARTLIVAAGKAGVVPSADHPQDAIKLRGIGNEMNPETAAYTHPAMRHPWNRQDPALFARTARAWFEKGEMPEGFKEL